MTQDRFTPPVAIHFGEAGQTRLVASVREAAECLASDQWPNREGPMFDMAARALLGERDGCVTAAEARQAFADAALEVRILAQGDSP